MDTQNIIRESTSSLIVLIQTNPKLGEEKTVGNRMCDDETQIRVILSEIPPFLWKSIFEKLLKLLSFFTSPDTKLWQRQRHYLTT